MFSKARRRVFLAIIAPAAAEARGLRLHNEAKAVQAREILLAQGLTGQALKRGIQKALWAS